MSREWGGSEFRPHEPSKRSYYEILGVSLHASQDEIQAAFRDLAKKQHPDVGGDENKFKEVTEAYETLRDPEKRRIYNVRIDIGQRQYHGSEKSQRDWSDGLGSFDFKKMMHQSGEDIEKLVRKAEKSFRDIFNRGNADPKSYKLYEEFNAVKESIRRAKERAGEVKTEAKENARSQSKGSQAGETASKPSFRAGRTQSTADKQEEKKRCNSEGIRMTASGVSIKKDSIFEYLVDSRGKKISSRYEKIEERDGYIIGINKPFERLLDRQTGQELSSLFDSIEIRGKLLIGKNKPFERLLNPETGKEMSHLYDRIEERNGYIIGTSKPFERLLDRRTGSELSSFYDRILVRDELLIGTNKPFERLLDPVTGKEISGMFERIERRGSQVIGRDEYSEKVIR